MRKLIYLIFCLLSLSTVSAQVDLDSLIRLCDVYKGTNSDSLRKYAHIGAELAEKEEHKNKLTSFYRYLGISYFQKQNYDTASVYLDKALALAINQENKDEEASVHLATGYMYGTQSNTKLLIEHLLKALPLFEALNNTEKTIETLVGVGSAFRRSGNQEMAVKYLNQTKEMIGESTNAFLNALTYFELGAVEPDRNKMIAYELKAVEYARIANNKELENLGNQALALAYLSDELKDYDKALAHAKECYRLACELGAKYYIYSALTMLSNIYSKQENYRECEIVSLQAWEMDSTNLAEARILARNIALANINLKNQAKATIFLEKYEELTNEYTEESYHKELVEMAAKYETEKKEMRIAALEKEQKLYIGLGIAIVVVLLLGIGFLFYRHRQEKELIAARSALDAEKAEREIIARDLHDGVGAMLSVVKNNMNIMKSYSIIENTEVDYFEKTLDGLDKSIAELRRVAHHIMPAVLIEKGLATALDDFCRSIPEAEFHCTESDCRFDPEKELVLYRCAYELVNNAMRHSGASRIDIHLNIGEEAVYLSVVDNGCGFDPKTAPEGMGMNNMHKRLSAFSGRMDVYSEPGKGTEVNIEMEI